MLYDRELDCLDQSSPMPIATLSRTMRAMRSGETLTVRANDPGFQSDLFAWVTTTGNRLVEFEEGWVQRAVITKT